MERRRAQYQHAVPRFILRHFVVNKSAGSRLFVDNGQRAFAENKRKDDRKRRHLPDRLNIYHMSAAHLVMAYEDESLSELNNTVDRNYGMMDLYVDPHHPDHDHIEKKLSQLESAAATVIRILVDALDSPSNTVRLQRRDLNTLRKFLIIMGYRGTKRGRQFVDNWFDDWTRRDIDAHIARHLHPGATARDVWLQNIKEILDTDYWLLPENPRIFVHDRNELETDMREKRIVFWRTRGTQEFITCSNGWGFVDSIMRDSTDVDSSADFVDLMRANGSEAATAEALNQPGPKGFFECLRLYPLHPRLSIALVSHFVADPQLHGVLPFLARSQPRYRDLPMPTCVAIDYKDLSPSAKEAHRRGNIMQYRQQEMRKYCFKPTILIDGKITESRIDDVFTFPISPLITDHTHRVNAMILENANDTITFCSPAQLYRSILSYEASDVWAHKNDFTILKKALRSFFNASHARATLASTPVISSDRALVWVRTPKYGIRDGFPDTKELHMSYRLALFSLRGLPLPKVPFFRSAMDHKMEMRRVFDVLNRCHDDSWLRNEESEISRRAAAGADVVLQDGNAKPGIRNTTRGALDDVTGTSQGGGQASKKKARKRNKGKKA